MERVTFSQAAEFLAQQLQTGNGLRRVGVVARASLEGVADVTKRLDDLATSALDKLGNAMDRSLADFKEEHQRSAMRLSYAGSLRLPAAEQLRMVEAGKDSEAVATAAARQPWVPVEVQRFLANECQPHRGAMIALAQRRDADLEVLNTLATHPEKDVRITVAANLGARMRLSEPHLTDAKQAIYNSLLNRFEGDFAPHLVPVCRNEQHLGQMYSHTVKTPGNGRLFVENPFTPDQVLLDISTSMSLRLMPGGMSVAADAKQQVEKRLAARNDADMTPEPY
jgi:hypothetical protein